jgi:hypothetical protein
MTSIVDETLQSQKSFGQILSCDNSLCLNAPTNIGTINHSKFSKIHQEATGSNSCSLTSCDNLLTNTGTISNSKHTKIHQEATGSNSLQ